MISFESYVIIMGIINFKVEIHNKEFFCGSFTANNFKRVSREKSAQRFFSLGNCESTRHLNTFNRYFLEFNFTRPWLFVLKNVIILLQVIITNKILNILLLTVW